MEPQQTFSPSPSGEPKQPTPQDIDQKPVEQDVSTTLPADESEKSSLTPESGQPPITDTTESTTSPTTSTTESTSLTLEPQPPVVPGFSNPTPPEAPAPIDTTTNMYSSPDFTDPAVIAAASSIGTVAPVKSRKKWLIPVIILAVVVILGGSAAAYFGYYLPNKPQNVLPKAIANTASEEVIKTAHLSGALTLKSAGFPLNFNGSVSGDFNDKGYDATLTLDASGTNMKAQLLSADGKTTYLKLSGLDQIPALLQSLGGDMAIYAPIVQALNGQWVSFASNSGTSSTSSMPSARLSDADAQKLGDAYRNHMFLEIPKQYNSEQVNGLDSFHYQVKINSTTLAAFLQQVKADNLKSFPLTDDQIASAKSANLSAHPFDVWIAKSKLIVDKIAFDGSASSMAYHFELSMGNINQPVTITAPTNAKTLQNALSSTSANSNSSIEKLLSGGTISGDVNFDSGSVHSL